jgi:alpha-1,6-mannosyltransferase
VPAADPISPAPAPARDLAAGLWTATTARLGSMRHDLGRAWGHRAVRRGTYGSLLLFGGSLTPAYLPQNSPWWEPIRFLGLDNPTASVVGTALVVLGVALLVEAWFRLRPSVYHDIKHWPITFWWSLPLLFAPPIFSHDAYGYAALGWLMRSGMNPYEVPIAALPGPFADQFSWMWRYNTAMYPPLSLEMFHGMVILAGNNPYLSALAMRIPAVIGVALITHYLPRIAQRMGADIQLTAWFSAINPLVIIDLVGGAHNDSLMMGLVVWALWLTFNGKVWPAAITVGVAACIKQPAILAFYPVALIGHPWDSLRWRDTWPALRRLVGVLVIAATTFALISLATGLGFGWIQAAGVPGDVVTLAPFTLVGAGLRYLFEALGLPAVGQIVMQVLRWIGLGLTAVAIGWLGLTVGRRKPITFLSWSYLIFAFGGIALNSWYLTWGGLLLPLTRPSRRIIGTAVTITTVLLAYGAGNLAWRNEAFALGFAALALLMVLLYRHRQEHNAHVAHAAAAQEEE